MSWLLFLAVPFVILAVRPGVSSSRRVLAGALVVLVPIAGPFLAMVVRRVRGGKVALEPVQEEARRRPSAADVSRLGELPPVLERLLGGDQSERLAALVHLSSVADAAAIAVLRWTIEHGPSDVVLEAALTLEEIDLRGNLPVPTLHIRPTLELEVSRDHDERERIAPRRDVASLVACELG